MSANQGYGIITNGEKICNHYEIYRAGCNRSTGSKPLATIHFQQGSQQDPDARHGVTNLDLIEVLRHRLQSALSASDGVMHNDIALMLINTAGDILQLGAKGTFEAQDAKPKQPAIEWVGDNGCIDLRIGSVTVGFLRRRYHRAILMSDKGWDLHLSGSTLGWEMTSTHLKSIDLRDAKREALQYIYERLPVGYDKSIVIHNILKEELAK